MVPLQKPFARNNPELLGNAMGSNRQLTTISPCNSFSNDSNCYSNPFLQGAFCLSMVNSSSKSTSTSLKVEFARSKIAEAFTWSIFELIGN